MLILSLNPYCLQNQIGFGRQTRQYCSNKTIPNLKVYDSNDNTEIKGSTISVSG